MVQAQTLRMIFVLNSETLVAHVSAAVEQCSSNISSGICWLLLHAVNAC